MSMWSKVKSVASKGNQVRKTANKAKELNNEVKENGVLQTAKNHIKARLNKKARKAMLQTGKALFKFLITPPWGWICTGVLIVLMCTLSGVFSSNTGQNIDNTSGDNSVTQDQYASMQVGCSTQSSGPVAESLDMKSSSSKFSIQQLSKWLSSPVTSTWNIDSGKAATYFLTKNQVISTKYGLNSNNISKVTDAVQSAGVSPVFFYLYSINEGGGAGGFVNHYSSSSGDAVADAKRDAEYLKQESNTMGSTVATGGGIGAMPTKDAQKVLDGLPKGSVGRAYLPATSAATGDIEELTSDFHMTFGPPLTNTMSNIQQLGGNPFSTGQMVETSANNNCQQSQTGLSSGGLNLQQARDFMQHFYDTKITQADIPGAAPGSPDIHDNCTAFESWFVHKYTGLNNASGNGKDITRQLVENNKGLSMSDKPSVYSVFSIQPNMGSGLTSGDSGHTGIVLGISGDKAIIGEGMYGSEFAGTSALMSGVNAQEWPLSKMNKSEGWSFVPLTGHLHGIG